MQPLTEQMPSEQTTRPLRLLVASTPKTGNTWVRNLLASVYDLPFIHSVWPFTPEQPQLHGPRWVTQQHYFPTDEVLRWAAAQQVIVVTTLRHPADALISLYHHVDKFRGGAPDPARLRQMLRGEYERPDILPEGVGAPFWHELGISLDWLRSGASLIVRYEDLWRDPVPTLQALTDRIRPVPGETIERALAQCDFDLMRRVAGSTGEFYREGRVGGWREVLGASVLDDLSRLEPYPAQIAALGYSLDVDDPLIAEPARERTRADPFTGVTHFDNGVPVPPLMIRLFHSVDGRTSATWHPVDRSDPDSFFAYANRPLDEPERGMTEPIVLTTLAAHAYRCRIDVQEAYPDPFGDDRVAFADWFVSYGAAEFALDPALTAPVRASLLAWGMAPAPEDPTPGGGRPLITTYALWLHRRRPDLQADYPDPFGQDRGGYAAWLARGGASLLRVEPDLLRPVRQSLHRHRLPAALHRLIRRLRHAWPRGSRGADGDPSAPPA